ncbi:YCF48-related protein [uncultured Cyclobacterium sp.]|uniref:YCF48-related protein n=1 Tax=uncultured Cyclobacterium sp. TaxID=453820 RepID=UPI0030EE92DC|tara:strand:- start:18092 stop:20899 length:2808 start_codon:yes stop_codon:yes gene_type:complete
MKRGLLLCFFALLLFQTGFGQSWRRVGDWGNDYKSIKWVNTNVGFIGGENILLKSIDGGLSWVEMELPMRMDVLDISFFDDQNGVLLNEEGKIFRSTNGGGSWSNPSYPENLKLNRVLHIDENRLIISGDDGLILRSVNGGANWNIIDVPTEASIKKVFFVDQDLGYAVSSDSEIIKTFNAGESWELYDSGFDVALNAVYFINDTTGYAVGDEGAIIKTEDGALNWQFINSGIDTDLTDVIFNPAYPLVGVISGDGGTILRTTNGGLTFKEAGSRTVQNIARLSIRPETNNILAVAPSGVLINSNNTGSTWSTRLSGTSSDFGGVAFTTDLRGYLVGDNGLILYTTNGGSSFNDRSRPISLPFNSLFFVSASAGYVSGNNGNIISTTNSGALWTTLNPGTNKNVYGFYFFDFNKGFAVGAEGLITMTQNQGVNWEVIPSGASAFNLKDILFFNENDGIIIGEKGLVLITSNGGLSWQRINMGSSVDLKAISILDDNTAIVVSSSGDLFKTSDKGINWAPLSTGLNTPLSDIAFLDESVGFITGENGLIMRTFDAGENWEKLETATYQNFTGISFGDLNVGYAVGENGIFYQYTCQVPDEIPTIFGEDNICISQQIYSVQDLGLEDENYEWRVDGGSIIQGQGSARVVVRWDNPGRNAVMVRGTNNCGNGETTALEVVVSEEPKQTTIIQGEGVVCVNTLEEYKVDSIPGTEYFWEATGGVVREGQGTSIITLEWTNLNEQSISVSTRNPCGQGPTTEKAIRVITIPDQPSTILGAVRVGFQEADYEITGERDVNYQWSVAGGGEIISGQGSSKVRINWTTAGDHVLEVTPINACNQGASRVLSVNVNLITSIEEAIDANIEVFPSPSFGGDVHVSVAGIGGLEYIGVYNAMGLKIKEVPTNEGQFVYSINGLPKGLHVLVLRSRTKEFKRKILVL